MKKFSPSVALAGLALVLGVLLALNGIQMVAEPITWWGRVPGVAQTGPLNQHLVRDIGLIYLLCACALVVGSLRPPLRLVSWSFAATWLALHAAVHLYEVMVGICGPNALLRDFVGVSLPALLATGLTLGAARGSR